MVNSYIIVGFVSMEVDMPNCPRCEGNLTLKEDQWTCLNPWCGYWREKIKPVLTQAELLEENKKLKETIAKLVKELCHNAHNVK